MKKYLVIGGSSGIGKQIITQLAQEGHQVFTTFNKHKIDSDDNIQAHQLDVTSDEVTLDFLPDSLDGLVYCPGSINLKPFLRMKPEEFMQDYALQVVGAVKVLQQTLPALKASKHGSIVMFSTVAVQNGFNFHSQVASSKGAVEGLIRSLSAELAPTIRVNGVAPSLTDTPLASALLKDDTKKKANADRHPLKAIGTVEDIAEAACYLLSDKSKWVTGQIMHVDGGMSSIRG